MAIYRFCFLDKANQARATEERNYAHDKQAIDNGAAIYAGHDGDRMEIWRASRLVQSYGTAPPSPHNSKPGHR